MNLKNILNLTVLGAIYLGFVMLVVQVHPGLIVSGLGLPAVTTAALHEVD